MSATINNFYFNQMTKTTKKKGLSPMDKSEFVEKYRGQLVIGVPVSGKPCEIGDVVEARPVSTHTILDCSKETTFKGEARMTVDNKWAFLVVE